MLFSSNDQTRATVTNKSKLQSLQDSTLATSINLEDSVNTHGLNTIEKNEITLESIRSSGNNPFNKTMVSNSFHLRKSMKVESTFKGQTTELAQLLKLANNASGISFKPREVYQKLKSKSFHDYKSVPVVTVHCPGWEAARDCRFHMQFKGKTPSLRDTDIRELIKKYPQNYVNIKQFIKDKGRFSTVGSELDNEDLIPERIKNSEVFQKIEKDEKFKKLSKHKLMQIMKQCRRVES